MNVSPPSVFDRAGGSRQGNFTAVTSLGVPLGNAQDLTRGSLRKPKVSAVTDSSVLNSPFLLSSARNQDSRLPLCSRLSGL